MKYCQTNVMLWPPLPWDSSHFPLCVGVCACCVPCGDSRGIARPATHRQAPSGSFTRAATALVPTSCSTAGTALTPAAVRLFRPPPLRWPSAVQPADCCSKLWWWYSRAFVTITAPTGLSITLHYGAIGPDGPVAALIRSLTEVREGAKPYAPPGRFTTFSHQWTLKEKIIVEKYCDLVGMIFTTHL